MTVRRVGFARWRSSTPSGGNRYDERVLAGLHDIGLEVREYPVTGGWPVPDATDRAALDDLLQTEDIWLIGNIVASAAPAQIATALAAGRKITVLLHYFPADDVALPATARQFLAQTEGQVIVAATNVVVTSAWAAAEVARRYGRHDAVVAPPGIERAQPAPGSMRSGQPPMLLWLGRLTTGKDPLTFIDALAQLRDLDFAAWLVGPASSEEAKLVQRRVDDAGLTDRVQLTGPRQGDGLDDIWAQTDLLVHTSHHETYGMVVAEALAHGIAAIVASGSGAVEAQRGVGDSFPPGDAEALACRLRRWLTTPELREQWRDQARTARQDLPTWADTARCVASAIAQ